jgi:hypothetical protein
VSTVFARCCPADDGGFSPSLTPPSSIAGLTPIAASVLLSNGTTTAFTLSSARSDRNRRSCAHRGKIQRRLAASCDLPSMLLKSSTTSELKEQLAAKVRGMVEDKGGGTSSNLTEIGGASSTGLIQSDE